MTEQDRMWSSECGVQPHSVKELQVHLKAHGVTISKLTKAPLIELCKAAKEIGLCIDPDGLTEDREEVINDKVTIDWGQLPYDL